MLYYYAVRKCGFLKSPAIYTSWDDLKFAIDVVKHDEGLEYMCFDDYEDAMVYILTTLATPPPTTTAPSPRKNKKTPTTNESTILPLNGGNIIIEPSKEKPAAKDDTVTTTDDTNTATTTTSRKRQKTESSLSSVTLPPKCPDLDDEDNDDNQQNLNNSNLPSPNKNTEEHENQDRFSPQPPPLLPLPQNEQVVQQQQNYNDNHNNKNHNISSEQLPKKAKQPPQPPLQLQQNDQQQHLQEQQYHHQQQTAFIPILPKPSPIINVEDNAANDDSAKKSGELPVNGGRNEMIWERKFQLLQEFRKQYGHCIVPTPAERMYKHMDEKYRVLIQWLDRERLKKEKIENFHQQQQQQQQQQQSMNSSSNNDDNNNNNNSTVEEEEVSEQQQQGRRRRRRRKRPYNDITVTRLQRLEEFGVLLDRDRQSDKEDDWNIMYNRLKQYKEQKNQMPWKISKEREENRRLYNFFILMRKHCMKYKADPEKYQQEKRNGFLFLDETKFQKLYDLGILGDENKKPPAEPSVRLNSKEAPSWNELFEMLKEFKAQRGHTNVPFRPPTMLRNWVVHQRELFIKMKQGKEKAEPPSCALTLTPERVAKLISIGFSFNPKAPKKLTIEERAVQWLEYREQHDGRDPPRHQHEVGEWIQRMRTHYRFFQNGDKRCKITQDQIDKLTAWGFRWETKRNPIHNKSTTTTTDDTESE